MKLANKPCYPTGNELITAKVERLKVFPGKVEFGIGQKYRKKAWEKDFTKIIFFCSEYWNNLSIKEKLSLNPRII